MKKALFAIAVASLAGCVEPVSFASNPRVLLMGDSLLDWNGANGKSVSDAMEIALNEDVVDRSVVGSRYLYPLPLSGALGMRIPAQYVAGDWEWVVLNGGGNDLWFGCGCVACDGTIERLISTDGQTGVIPALISKIRNNGARVLYVGYLRSPGVGSPIDHCLDEGEKLEGRIDDYAAKHDGVYFLSLDGVVRYGDRSYHSVDMIHPSPKASLFIGTIAAQYVER